MTKYRRAAKIDKNQADIVSDLRAMGYSVAVNHDDILVGYAGFTFWFEIKAGDCVSRRTGKIRQSAIKESQVKLKQGWKGHYKIVSSLAEILAEIKVRLL